MTARKPLIAALAAALLFAAYLADRSAVRERNLREAMALRIMEFDANGATEVRLDNPNGHFVIEKRAAGEWWLTQPREVRADDGQVRALIDNVRGAKKSAPSPADDLAKFGLEEPRARLSISGTAGGRPEHVALLIGADAPQLGRVHAMIEGEHEVFTLGDWIRNHAMKDLTTLRDKRLLDFVPASIREIAITRPDDKITLKRAESGGWSLDGGNPGDGDLIKSTLESLSTARALEIVDEPTSTTSQLGFDSPLATVTLRDSAGESSELVLGARARTTEAFFAKSSSQPGTAVVRAAAINGWLRPRAAWGSRRLIWIPRADYTRIETSSGSAKMVLVRTKGGAWQFEEHPEAPVHPGKLEAFLAALEGLSGERLIDETIEGDDETARYGLNREGYRLTVSSADGKVSGFLQGSVVPSDEITYLQRAQDGSVWSVNFRVMDSFFKFRRDLEDRRINTDLAGKVRRFRLIAGSTAIVFAQNNGVWRMEFAGKPSQIVPDVDVEAFLGAVEELEWEEALITKLEGGVNLRVELYGDAEAALYTFDIMEDSSRRLLRSSAGNYEVGKAGFAKLDAAMVRLLEAAKEPAP
ncbi:DUF4340 domain-containing protein [Candidatus Poribacteria bacterium]|nr:DUF4340 domain-containing protein [Candidatus Poribacteria bacterium]